MSELHTLYQTDVSAWVQRHAKLLRAGRYLELDVEHLLEELSDMSKSERRELECRLLIVLAHLLKWEYQYPILSERWREFDGRSWRANIIKRRVRLAKLLTQAPGLQTVLAEAIAAAHDDAVILASDETGLSPDTFPSLCPTLLRTCVTRHFIPRHAHHPTGLDSVDHQSLNTFSI